MLPPWAKLHRINPTLPLARQVTNARVLIPTTGHVDAHVIAAAPHCKLIAQPAAGTANIDKEEAKRRGIPVTYAPGELFITLASTVTALIVIRPFVSQLV
jgi:phosphoglycerate dehydrogenase-like enzyme